MEIQVSTRFDVFATRGVYDARAIGRFRGGGGKLWQVSIAVRRRWSLPLALILAACRADEAPLPAEPSVAPKAEDGSAAREMLALTPLPPRAEVVALTDRLSIESSRAGRSAGGAELAWLAAQLRERIWRVDRVATDGREAIELYGAAIERATSPSVACDAETRRGLLAGELERSADTTYRELYVAHERLAAVEGARSRCLERVKHLVDSVAAYRPTGQAWRDLENQARRDVDAVVASAKPVASAAAEQASAADVPAPSAAEPLGDVVVKPDETMLRTGKVELREVKPYSYPGGGRVVIGLSGPVRYEVGVLAPDATAARGHRIFVDVAGAKPRSALPDLAADGLVSAVRIGKRDSGTRVVIDLTAKAHHRVFYLPDPFRIVIDVSTREAAPAEQPKSGRRAVARVTLDPGHGGWDSGAMGPTGLREKDVALDVAHRAAPALASELGIETMLTRDNDVFVPLEERTARANAFHSDLFVSIHCNATEDGHADGVEIYMLDPTRQMDAASLRAVNRENHNAKERARAVDAKVLDAQVASIAAGLNVADAANRSRSFARLLETSTLASLSPYGKISDHGVKTAGFFVLLGAEMPAALFETSFISNPTDEARLGTADYRQKLADAVVNAVRAYRDGLGAQR